MPHTCAGAHTYIREFSKENSKLKVPRHFSGAFKPLNAALQKMSIFENAAYVRGSAHVYP